MNNLNELMNAFARFMEKPRNPVYALQDLCEVMDKNGREAMKEHDNLQQDREYLEAENAHLRKLLREAGIAYRPGGEAA